MDMQALPAILSIVLIDLVLSGDNAVVIGMAAHRLPSHQRRTAILIGGGAAIVLRIALTLIATFLLAIPGLRLIGGLLLIWIAVKLLDQDEATHEGVKVAASMSGAIVTILVADFIMSLDNVLGVAGASGGHLGLLVFGLILSMAILMFMGSMVATLINRFWWLSYVGAGVIAWIGADMVFKDPLARSHLPEFGVTFEHMLATAIMAGALLFAHWFHRIRGAARPI
jgi:YjbE family integral membrane protein